MKRFRFKADAALEAQDIVEAFTKIRDHFDAQIRQMEGEAIVTPNTFTYDSQLRVYPVRLVEEEITLGDPD